jgi:hypothetical protein
VRDPKRGRQQHSPGFGGRIRGQPLDYSEGPEGTDLHGDDARQRRGPQANTFAAEIAIGRRRLGFERTHRGRSSRVRLRFHTAGWSTGRAIGEGWVPCAFWGVPAPPDELFPHTNDTADFRAFPHRDEAASWRRRTGLREQPRHQTPVTTASLGTLMTTPSRNDSSAATTVLTAAVGSALGYVAATATRIVPDSIVARSASPTRRRARAAPAEHRAPSAPCHDRKRKDAAASLLSPCGTVIAGR